MESILDKIRLYNSAFDENKIKLVFSILQEKDLDNSFQNYSIGILDYLLPIKPDDSTIIAVLLYPLYVNNLITDEKVIEKFGVDVFNILDAAKKIRHLNYQENDATAPLEALRKMYVTLAKDLRVILIKLSGRLYKMNNLSKITEPSQYASFAKETFDVYVPLASRLGLYRFKVNLEDIAFKYLNPEEYENINKQLEKFGKSRRIAIETVKRQLEEYLKSMGYDVEVFGRFKNVYSIYKKLQIKNLNKVEELFDIFAMRIILPDKNEEDQSKTFDHLYNILGLIHSKWRPISKRFKDYIAVPKPNGYRSLHTVVLEIGPENFTQPVEIQIRTDRMHDEAEYGVASHWIYKHYRAGEQVDINRQVEWLRGLEKIQENLSSEMDLLREVEIDIFKDRIFVLTPRGEIKDLPAHSTPIDFAYSVHTEVGHKCVMAKVNGSIVSLNHELKNSDVVEIITKRESSPKLEWLSFVKTDFSKDKIRAYFNKLDRENHIKEGKLLLNKHLERLGKPSLDQTYSIFKNYCGRILNLAQRESLIEEVGKGGKIASDAIRKVLPYENILVENQNTYVPVVNKKEFKKIREEEGIENRILIGGEDFLPLKIGACCLPKEGDKIIGYVTRGNRVTIHKFSCPFLDNLDKRRLISANFKSNKLDKLKFVFPVKIEIHSRSRIGLIRDISSVIANMGIDIEDMHTNILEDGSTIMNLLLNFDNLNKFDFLLNKLESVPNVISVKRELQK